MALKVFSFLGTNDYIPCNYVFENKIKYENSKFFILALGEYLRQYKNNDIELIILCTKEAEDNNLKDRKVLLDGKEETYEGLVTAIEKNSMLKNKYKVIYNIPFGTTKEETWSLFNILLNEINSDDEIVFDVTHGFRSLPLIAVVIANYAKYLYGVSLRGLYYGAFEKLGRAYEVKAMPIENRNVDVFDLSSFNLLLDWTFAIDKYLSTGEIDKLNKLMKETESRIETEDLGKEEINSFEEWIATLKDFSYSVGICDSNEISRLGVKIKDGCNYAKKVANKLVPALDKAMIKIENKYEKYRPSNLVYNVNETVKWCCEHNMIQQGYTLLRENIITYVYDILKFENSQIFNRILNVKRITRDEASYILRDYIKNSLIRGKKELEKLENYDSRYKNKNYRHKPYRVNIFSQNSADVTENMVFEMIWNSEILNDIYAIFKDIRLPRNVINHAGYVKYKNKVKTKGFSQKLKHIVNTFDKITEISYKGEEVEDNQS